MFLEILQNSHGNTCASASFLIKLQALLKKETLAQVFFCKFWKMSKNTFSIEHLRATASVKRDPSTGAFLCNLQKKIKNTLFEEHLLTTASQSILRVVLHSALMILDFNKIKFH